MFLLLKEGVLHAIQARGGGREMGELHTRSLTLFSLFLNFSLFAVPRNSRNRQEDRFLDEYWDETDPHDTHSGCETISKVVRMDFATF